MGGTTRVGPWAPLNAEAPHDVLNASSYLPNIVWTDNSISFEAFAQPTCPRCMSV